MDYFFESKKQNFSQFAGTELQSKQSSAQSISVEFCPFSTLVSVTVFWSFHDNFFFWIRNFRTSGTPLNLPGFVSCAANKMEVMLDIFVFQASSAFFFFSLLAAGTSF